MLESFILVAICLNFITLLMDAHDKNLANFLDITEYIFTTVFFTEMMIKILAFGLFFGPEAYLKDSWNCLDFVVVLTSLITLLPSSNLPGVSGMRALRALRPLRTIKRIPKLKVLVNVILSSIVPMQQVAVFGCFLFILFGILAIELWCGDFHYRWAAPTNINSTCIDMFDVNNCMLSNAEADKTLCKVGEEATILNGVEYSCVLYEENPMQDFISHDNIISSIYTLSQVMNNQAWGSIMAWTIEASGPACIPYYILVIMFFSFLFRFILLLFFFFCNFILFMLCFNNHLLIFNIIFI